MPGVPRAVTNIGIPHPQPLPPLLAQCIEQKGEGEQAIIHPMPDSFEDQGWVRMGVASALDKAYAADQRQFLGFLAEALEKALPGETQIRRAGLFSNKHIVAITIQLGNDEFLIEDPGRGPLRAAKGHVVRGIKVKTEDISMEQALAEIGEALDARAKQSEAARNALATMLGLS